MEFKNINKKNWKQFNKKKIQIKLFKNIYKPIKYISYLEYIDFYFILSNYRNR